MKIYVLRHEERVHDASFFSVLTENGVIKSNHLVKDLEKVNITKIFCSPFIRTMQTIIPYSRKHNIPLNLDYALSEIKLEKIIPRYAANVTLPKYIAEQFNYNPNYISSIKTENINYPESREELKSRLIPFIQNIIDTYINTNENILIVTHQSLCEIVANAPLLFYYPMGQLSLVFDQHNWIYKKIN